MTATSKSYFRVMALPFDILECLTLYFYSYEAFPLLTVSSSFYDVFIRSAWRVLMINGWYDFAPVLPESFPRYGHLVRTLNLEANIHKTYCWHYLFPNVTRLNFGVGPHTTVEQLVDLIDAVLHLHGLQSLGINFLCNPEKLNLSMIGVAVIARNNDITKQSLKSLVIEFVEGYQEDIWTQLANFAVTLADQRLCNLGFAVRLRTPIDQPTAEQARVLQSHIIELPPNNELGRHQCYAPSNDILYGPFISQPGDGSLPHLTTLVLSACCAIDTVYNYSGINPIQLPSVSVIKFRERICYHVQHEAELAIDKVFSHHWPKLDHLEFSIMSEYVSLLHILDLNPHITKFVFKDHSCLMDNNYVLDIADFIQRLPSLRCLDVVCYCCRSLRMDCSLDGLEVLPRNLEHIRFEKCQLHTSVIEMLLLLPRLHKFSVLRCTMDDVLEAMQFIERIQYDDTIGVYPRTIQCFEFEAPHRDNPWSLGYIVALLSLMPCIKRVSLSRCNPKFVESVRQQLPHVKVNKL